MDTNTEQIHFGFPKIRQFHQVVTSLKLRESYRGKDENGDNIYVNPDSYPTITFEGRVKLHGTNSAIVFDLKEGTRYFQSRERIITPLKDNAGFAAWAETSIIDIIGVVGRFFHLNEYPPARWIVIYGEWCGGSIQKGVALSQLDKMFVIFGAKLVQETGEVNSDGIFEHDHTWLDTSELEETETIKNISRIPSKLVHVDLNEPILSINLMNDWVESIDKTCPFSKSLGAEGTGEGLVFRPVDSLSFRFAFKVKGEGHSKSNVKTLATVDVERYNSIQVLVDTLVHEDRLNQAWDLVVNEPSKKVIQSIAEFIRWIVKDVAEEELESIVASGFVIKDINAPISKKAGAWFKNKLQEESLNA